MNFTNILAIFRFLSFPQENSYRIYKLESNEQLWKSGIKFSVLQGSQIQSCGQYIWQSAESFEKGQAVFRSQMSNDKNNLKDLPCRYWKTYLTIYLFVTLPTNKIKKPPQTNKTFICRKILLNKERHWEKSHGHNRQLKCKRKKGL